VRFKLDENLGKGHANLLRLAGFDAHTVPDEGLEGSTDFEVIRAARDEGRCLITLDLDFSNPLAFPPSEYRGIILLRCGPRTERYQSLLSSPRSWRRCVRNQPIFPAPMVTSGSSNRDGFACTSRPLRLHRLFCLLRDTVFTLHSSAHP